MTITIFRPEERELQPVGSSNPAPKSAKDASLKQILSANDPYVQINSVKPGTSLPVHSHSESEVMILLSGSAVVGGTPCSSGTVALIPADEKYGIEVGEETLVFVVIRAHPAVIEVS